MKTTLLKRLPILTGTFTSEELGLLKNHPSVLHIEKDQIVKIDTQEQNWGIEKIGISKSWNSGHTGKGIKISILDTGIDTNHEDLVVMGGTSYWGENFDDDSGHGTHVAGIIGAQNNDIGTVGVAPDAKLYAVKVLNSMGWGYTSDIIKGLNWSIENDIDVINMSLGFSEDSPAMELALTKVKEEGILVIAAAGNNGLPGETYSTVNYPAKYPSVIAVGSININNNRSSFSSVGEEVEFTAPGTKIKSTLPTNSYGVNSGTSIAAPFVSGLSALYLQAYPGHSSNEIRMKMMENVIDLGDKGRDAWYGYGLLQSPDPFIDFEDVNYEHWAYDFIKESVKRKWMMGKTETLFFPEDSLTRAQAATVLTRVLNLTVTDPTIENFPDVDKSDWYSNSVLIMKQHQIFIGNLNGNFNPNEPLTRAQMSVAISRALSLKNSNLNNYDFKDVSSTHWAYESIMQVVDNEIFNGYKNGEFRPDIHMTRAEAAVVLNHMIPLLSKK